MNNNQHRVILVNRSLGITTPTVKLCGHSGKNYGISVYDQNRNAHVVELSLEDYRKAIPDISRNWHKSRCRWEPDFIPAGAESNIVTPKTNPELRDMAIQWAKSLNLSDLVEIIASRDENGEASKWFLEKVHGSKQTAQVVENQPKVVSSTTPFPTQYLAVAKLAKEEGIDILDSNGQRIGTKALTAAILAKRQQAA